MLVVTFLGTADSAGTPVHRCDTPVCHEAKEQPWLRRRQSCVLVRSESANILVDMDTDAHMEKLYNLPINAVCITHLHWDHVAGLIALRWTQQPGGIPVYYPAGPVMGDGAAILDVGENLHFHKMDTFEPLTVEDMQVMALPLSHGSMVAQGYFIESGAASVAVLFDTSGLPAETYRWLSDHKPNLALVDACFAPGRASGGHNNVDEAVEIIQRLDVERGVLTHIAPHNLPYTELVAHARKLDGSRTIVSYDGLSINL